MIPAKALEKRRCLAWFFTSLSSVAAFRGAGACLQRNHSPPCQKAKLLTSGRKNRMLYSPIHLHPVFFLLQKGNLSAKRQTLLHTNSIMENARIGGILQGEKDLLCKSFSPYSSPASNLFALAATSFSCTSLGACSYLAN